MNRFARLGALAVFLLVASFLSCRGEPTPTPNPRDPRPAARALEVGPVPEGVGREGRELLRVGPLLAEVEVAAVQESRARGLGGRESLDDDDGMLFIYPDARERSFWMKDCLIPLDIAYLDDERRIFQIGTVPPPRPGSNEIPRFPSKAPARYVLEMRAGWFREKGIGPGTSTAFSASLEEWVKLVVEEEALR